MYAPDSRRMRVTSTNPTQILRTPAARNKGCYFWTKIRNTATRPTFIDCISKGAGILILWVVVPTERPIFGMGSVLWQHAVPWVDGKAFELLYVMPWGLKYNVQI
jgi:hypothetical protein